NRRKHGDSCLGFLRRSFCHRCLSPPPQLPPPPQAQPTTRPKTLAHNREPQPHRRTPPPFPPRALQEMWTSHASPVRVVPHRGGFFCRDGQNHPQNPRRHLLRQAQNHRGKVHHLQLLRYHMVALRTLLAPGT
ncbi:hypothetical protein Tsubulata_022125, partial [Turnera subulata]